MMRCVAIGVVLLKSNIAEFTSFNIRHQIIDYIWTKLVTIDGYVLTVFKEICIEDYIDPQTTSNLFFWMLWQLYNLFRSSFIPNLTIFLVYILIKPEMYAFNLICWRKMCHAVPYTTSYGCYIFFTACWT